MVKGGEGHHSSEGDEVKCLHDSPAVRRSAQCGVSQGEEQMTMLLRVLFYVCLFLIFIFIDVRHA